jgi:inosine/xanthosine triphosphatase
MLPLGLEIVITSKNPVKIEATLRAFRKVFPNEDFDIETVSVDSGVSDQPMSDRETYDGASNRVKAAERKYKGADFYIGLEGGLDSIDRKVYIYGWIVIKSGKRIGRGRTVSIQIPKKVYKLLTDGKELGDAMDQLFRTKNVKQKEGAFGILTKGAIKRVNVFSQAVISALVPFINEKLY